MQKQIRSFKPTHPHIHPSKKLRCQKLIVTHCNLSPLYTRLNFHKIKLKKMNWQVIKIIIAAKNCYDLYEYNYTLPGIYNLSSIGPVQCLEDGWTSIQHRGQYGNPRDYFSKNWADYVTGFGSPGKKIDIRIHKICTHLPFLKGPETIFYNYLCYYTAR